MSNLHAHSFQRAMAGLAERQGDRPGNDFWSWRKVMYRFLEILSPEDIEHIAAFAQMEMLEAGYAAQAEFHYLHHAPNGAQYDQIHETSRRLLAAAKRTGIGYTHLPVLYMQAGLNGEALDASQQRFGCLFDAFAHLIEAIKSDANDIAADDFILGVAPHSLRAVPPDALDQAAALLPAAPFHIHIAEQMSEVAQVNDKFGTTPVDWLCKNNHVDQRWCLVHATHMTGPEIKQLATSGAVAGLCPLTEANLGDGIFPASAFKANGGTFGIGTDSNINISLSEELRQLETSQRLRDQRRIILSDDNVPSNGRALYQDALKGGARALGRDSGAIKIGAYADLVALDDQHVDLVGLEKDATLDTWIFANATNVITDVWAAGRHMVENKRHTKHDEITASYRTTIKKIRAMI